MIDPVPDEDLSAPWCNADAVTTSVMEAVSFVTPLVEKFLVRAVAEGMDRKSSARIDMRCRAFIREESRHSRDHIEFNASLFRYLGTLPPGLALVQSLLDAADRRLSLFSRLLLVAGLEHFSAVLSKRYLARENTWCFRSASARELFAQHAREELSHRSVVFDLCVNRRAAANPGRVLVMLAILLGGFAYVTAAVPWIIYRKTGRRARATLIAVAGRVAGICLDTRPYSMLGELFSFVRVGYHPDRIIANGAAD